MPHWRREVLTPMGTTVDNQLSAPGLTSFIASILGSIPWRKAVLQGVSGHVSTRWCTCREVVVRGGENRERGEEL